MGLFFCWKSSEDLGQGEGLFVTLAPTLKGQGSEVDLNILWQGLRRRWPYVLGPALLLALLTFVWTRNQPTVYETSVTLIAANNQGQDASLSTALVKAPPLPEGAVVQALQSTQVVLPLLKSIESANTIPEGERERLVAALSRELRNQQLRTVMVSSNLDPLGNGLYTLRARARTPKAAQALADLASTSLLSWDRNRALDNLRRAQSGFLAQRAQVDAQLENAGLSSVERQTLIARRANIQGNLTQVQLLEDSVAGVLSTLSSAVEPLAPVAPKPVRNAVLVGLLSLLVAIGVISLLTTLDRTIRNEDDLLTLGVPTLAVIPRMRQRDVVFSGVIRAARQAGLYEAIGFLRVNILTALAGKPHPVLMVTSTAPGEGKSSLTAALADGFASSGQRVLIIDADLRRGTQAAVWQRFDAQGQWQALYGSGGARTTPEALRSPRSIEVIQVEENVHMLPTGPGLQDSLSVFNQADLKGALDLWRREYDIVLIDSAPLLALADGLVLGAQVDAVLMVTEYGKTHIQAVRAALRRSERAGLNILGFIINKVSAREEQSYGYTYGYSAQADKR